MCYEEVRKFKNGNKNYLSKEIIFCDKVLNKRRLIKQRLDDNESNGIGRFDESILECTLQTIKSPWFKNINTGHVHEVSKLRINLMEFSECGALSYIGS